MTRTIAFKYSTMVAAGTWEPFCAWSVQGLWCMCWVCVLCVDSGNASGLWLCMCVFWLSLQMSGLRPVSARWYDFVQVRCLVPATSKESGGFGCFHGMSSGFTAISKNKLSNAGRAGPFCVLADGFVYSAGFPIMFTTPMPKTSNFEAFQLL